MNESLETIFATYYKDVYTYLFSLTHDAALSEDLAADVFVEVVRSLSKFRGESDIKTWLFSIARHKWFAYLRQKKRQVTTEALSEFVDFPGKAVEECYQNQALLERIYRLIDAEPERTKSIVLMRISGLSFYEIGQKHNISENSARVIDFRAKTKIRKILKEEGYSDE